MKQFKNYTYLLYGLGINNLSVKKFFEDNEFNFKEYEDGVEEYDLSNIDIIVKSPGIFPNTKLLQEAKEKNILVINDLELFSWIYPNSRLIIITGTNGKTSTSKMVASIISKKYKCYLGGNIGIPLFNLKSKKKFKDEYVVVEASSYMLDNCYSVHPNVLAILNISEHHLDYHKDFKNYWTAKTKLKKNLNETDLLIIPNESVYIDDFKDTKVNKILFDFTKTNNGLYIKDNKVYYGDEIVYIISNYPIFLKHQLKNVLVASSIGIYLNISISKIRKALEDISFENFRLQNIYSDDKTLILNDSKATNIEATHAALESIVEQRKEIHWILGGFGPSNIDRYLDVIDSVDHLYLIGENRYLLHDEFYKNNIMSNTFDSLEEVINTIYNCDNDKIILFSPGAQSYDQYNNYIERGEHFNFLINKYWHN